MALYGKLFKRVIDLLTSLVALVIFSPVLIVVTILLLIANSGSPFFIQRRPGKDEKIFRLVKFKTMNDKKDPGGNLLPDMERLTSIGRFLRRSSLDEIPQFFNVLTGKMSLIGPRPLLIEYLEHYNDFQKRRHEAKPGITGWAQVNGRNSISWEEKFNFDVWYVDHLSLKTDLMITWKTLVNVLNQKGINSSNERTMEKFRGSKL